MDLSKTYDCISHNLLVAKIEACGLHRNALTLVYNILIGSTYSQQNKLRLEYHRALFMDPYFSTSLSTTCDTSLEAVMTRLEVTCIACCDGLKTNPSKFQIMFLGQKDMNSLCLNINGLLYSLKFEAHITELCRKVNL